MTSSRVLFRTLIGINVVLFVGYTIQLVVAVMSGSDPWAGLAVGPVAGLAVIVFFVLVPVAAAGFSALLAV